MKDERLVTPEQLDQIRALLPNVLIVDDTTEGVRVHMVYWIISDLLKNNILKQEQADEIMKILE